MNDNTAWLANLKVGDEVGVRFENEHRSDDIGVVHSIYDNGARILITGLSRLSDVYGSVYNSRTGEIDRVGLFGKSWLIPIYPELRERIDRQKRKDAAISIIADRDVLYEMSLETLERMAAFIREEQAK